jgi:hypothetical protein
VEEEMKRTTFLAIVLLAFAFAAHAQDTMKKDAAVKPADPESKVVLDSWNEIGRKLTALAEDFPEDKYDFKPTPAQRSFAEQLLHAAGSCYYFTNPAMGLKPPAAEDPKREQYKSKADIVAFVKKSFADGNRHPVERRKRPDDGGCLLPSAESARYGHRIRHHRA